MKRIIFIITFVTFSSIALFAQNSDGGQITFRAYSPDSASIKAGEQFRVIFELSVKNVQSDMGTPEFNAPDFKGLSVSGGPYPSQSSYTTIINGKMTSSQSIIYTYILQTPKAKIFVISPATIVVKNDTVQSNPLTLTALPASKTENKEKMQQKSELSFYVIAPDSVQMGEKFSLIFTVNSSEKFGFKSPPLTDFNILKGPTIMQGTVPGIADGEVVWVGAQRIVYVLSPKKEGQFKILPATIVINNKKYRTKETTIKVIPKKERNYSRPVQTYDV